MRAALKPKAAARELLEYRCTVEKAFEKAVLTLKDSLTPEQSALFRDIKTLQIEWDEIWSLSHFSDETVLDGKSNPPNVVHSSDVTFQLLVPEPFALDRLPAFLRWISESPTP